MHHLEIGGYNLAAFGHDKLIRRSKVKVTAKIFGKGSLYDRQFAVENHPVLFFKLRPTDVAWCQSNKA